MSHITRKFISDGETPLTPIKERRFDRIERAQDLVKAENAPETAEGARSDLLWKMVSDLSIRDMFIELSDDVKLKGFSDAEENMKEFLDRVSEDMLPLFIGIHPWLDREIGKRVNGPIQNNNSQPQQKECHEPESY